MDKRKTTLGIIITLLVIFLPLTIVSFSLHKKYATPVDENPNHLFYLNNKLYFYSSSDKLLGTYECSNTYCDYAIVRTNDTYDLYEYTPSTTTKMSLINDHYAFIMDTDLNSVNSSSVILYDTLKSSAYEKYQTVQNYGIGISGNYYIVEDMEGNYGVLQISDTITTVIPCTYDYIGLSNTIVNGVIDSSAFAVLKDGYWKLVDSNNKNLTKTFSSSIVSYDSDYIVLKDEYQMYLLDYEGESYLTGEYKHISFYEDYLEIINSDNEFYLYDLETNKVLSDPIYVNSIDNINLVKEGSLIRIYLIDDDGNRTLAENVEIE